MPLTVAGKLDIVATADLGGLGLPDGPPVAFSWVMPSVAPVMIPWLVILGLLTARANRCAQAWLIWLPIACVIAIEAFPPSLPFNLSILLDPFAALATAVAAVWLLGYKWQPFHRMLAFLCILITLIGFGMFNLFCKLGTNFESSETVSIVFTLMGLGVTSVALSLTGLICRKRFRPIGVYVWFLIFLAGIWFVITAPFFAIAMATSGAVSPGQFFAPLLGILLLNFAAVIPFLILSSISRFYRERLKALLQVRPEPPPVPEPEVNLTVEPNKTQTS